MPTGQTASAIATAKTLGYLGSFAFFEYLGIPQTQVWILGLLMVIDFASGVGKQFRIDKKGITSHAAWLGVVKKAATLVSVLTIALIFKGLEMDADGYIKGVLSILIMAEGYSVIQNIYTIRTGKILPEFDVISALLKSFSEFLKDRIDGAVKTSGKPEKTPEE